MNLLSLEEFRKIIGHEPYHFWQLTAEQVPSTSSCDNILRKYRSQNAQAVGRHELEEAINQAETDLVSYLGYYPGQSYQTVKLPFGCPSHPYNYFNLGRYQRRYSNELKLGLGKLQSIGTVIRQQVSGTFNVSYDDKNGDGLNDYFKVDITDSTSDPLDFEAYFAAADRIELDDADVLANWQIRPVKVIRLNPTTIRIEGYSWLLVKPELYERSIFPGFNPEISGTNTSGAFDADTVSNFVSTLEIYKKVVTDANKITLTVTDSSGNSTVTSLDAFINDPENGLIHVSQGCLNVFPGCYCSYRQAYFTVNFTSGDDLQRWRNTIARLALADIAAPLCPCDGLEVEHWQNDRAVTGNGQGGFSRIDNDDLKNPLGTREGQIAAWHQVKNLRILEGVSV